MDVLSDLLKSIQLKSAVYWETHLYGDWGARVDKVPWGVIHLLVEGSCWVRVIDSGEKIFMSSGDIIFFPFGQTTPFRIILKALQLIGGRFIRLFLVGKRFSIQARKKRH